MENLHRCFRKHLPKSIDLEKWQTTVDLISELYGTACGVIVQIRDEEFSVVKTSANDDNFLDEGQTWSWDIKSFCRNVVESKCGLYAPNAPEIDSWADAPAVENGPVVSYLGEPIFWPDGTVFGTICSIDVKETNYSFSLQKLLSQLRDLIAADLKHITDYQKLEVTAVTDELTQLYNLRGAITLGEQRISDAQRFNFDIGLVYFDIDNLKRINDSLGHAEGDRCLVGFSTVLVENFRNSDIIARVGGDEFLVILLCEAHEKHDVTSCCRRIDQVFGERFLSTYSKFNLSVSYGVDFFNASNGFELNQMIETVDQLMYCNKREKKREMNLKSD